MKYPRFCTIVFLSLLLPVSASGQSEKPFQPYSGQPGKDVIWVPTPDTLVEKMLDLAAVTPQDYVIDLGSGDGRMIIAAAKRGARALGVEFNPDMVEFAQQRARDAGVADKAMFVEGDMFEADISSATVLALFLLPENLDRLAKKFLDLSPGTRIVLNEFVVSGWRPDRSEQAERNCDAWCNAHLYIVPAKVEGEWRVRIGEQEGVLSIAQTFQMLRGELKLSGKSLELEGGRMDADRIEFAAAGIRYVARVNGNAILDGTSAAGPWTGTRR
jgi:SAM-dependent methyltransferase